MYASKLLVGTLGTIVEKWVLKHIIHKITKRNPDMSIFGMVMKLISSLYKFLSTLILNDF